MSFQYWVYLRGHQTNCYTIHRNIFVYLIQLNHKSFPPLSNISIGRQTLIVPGSFPLNKTTFNKLSSVRIANTIKISFIKYKNSYFVVPNFFQQNRKLIHIWIIVMDINLQCVPQKGSGSSDSDFFAAYIVYNREKKLYFYLPYLFSF